MDFVAENYLWFVAIGLILLMTIMGYLAEKTDFIARQKERDIKRKEKAEKQKLEKIAKKQKHFEKEIGDGEDLVLDENNLTYPVELDGPAASIEIPTLESQIEETKTDSIEILGGLEPTGELKMVDIQNAMEEYNASADNGILEKGVLNLDSYDNEMPIESTESIAEMNSTMEPTIEESIIETEPVSPIEIEEITEENLESIEEPVSEITNEKKGKSKSTKTVIDADNDVWKF